MLDLDAAWVIGCAGLVLLMQPGFMCLESGLTRSKNSINVAVKNLADLGISICFFWGFGYALMFGASQAGWIGTSGFFLDIESDAKLAAFFLFQMMFCGTATTIVSGALAERQRFQGYIVIAVVISGLIYPIFGHWAWNDVNTAELSGWLGRLGFVDFAGSSVVHSIGGWVSLAALLIVGPRTGRFTASGRHKIHGSNLPFSVLGVMLLWVGWLGFNGGSTFALSDQVPKIIVHTVLAGGAGMIAAGGLGWYQVRVVEAETLINGSIAGLVSITASCNVVSTPLSILIGAMGGIIMLLATRFVESLNIDDGVDAVALHGFCGVWGTLAVGLFGDLGLLATGLSRHNQVVVQLLGIGVAFLWGFGITYLILSGLNRIFPFRVSIEEEEMGLNVSEHQAKTEVYELFRVMDQQAETQDFSLRVPEEPFTNVGKIAHRYNQVMDSLETYSVELEAMNTTLEKKVEQRTLQLASSHQKLEQANQELKRLDQLKDEFLANTSHELRTPLNGIIGLSEYLLEGSSGPLPEQVSMNLAMISKSGRRLYRLVNDLLDFSKILHDSLTLNLQPVGLREIADWVLVVCQPLVGNKSLQLVNTVPAGLPLAWADEDRLQQILYNLVGNAIKFTESGRVEVSASLSADDGPELAADAPTAASSVTMSVTDTGIGIPIEAQETIFESFEQVQGGAHRQYGGLGIGLAISKKLVEFHGSRLEVVSSEGEGARFQFALPIQVPTEVTVDAADVLQLNQAGAPTEDSARPVFVEAPPEVLSEGLTESARVRQLASSGLAESRDIKDFNGLDVLSEAIASINPDSSGDSNDLQRNILIVDDDPINLLVLNNYLSLLSDYNITQAESGQDALDLLAQGYCPDLIVLDVMMPRMTGYEVVKTIRTQWQRHELPIVLLTAKNQLEDEITGLTVGANDYLTKPVVKEGLLARIKTQLALRQESLEKEKAQAERTEFAEALAKTNEELLSAQAALVQQNATLEDQVAQRTAVLAESQRTLATLMRNLPGMAYRCLNDPHWTMLFVSEGAYDLTGYTPEDWISRAIRYAELIHPEDAVRNRQVVKTALGQKERFQMVYRLALPLLNAEKWVWSQGQGIYNSAGELKFIEGFIIDISDRIYGEKALEKSNQELKTLVAQIKATQAELKIAKEKSEAANQAKSEFLANMSHELRTPLNSIIGFAQLLDRDTSLKKQQQQRIQIINRSGEHLLSLINNILDISKIEAGKITLSQRNFDLHELLQDIANLFELKTQKKGLTFVLKRGATVPQFVCADEGKLRQVLTNLVSNSVKFTDEGEVEVSVEVPVDTPVNALVQPVSDDEATAALTLRFAVKDSGIGIASDDIERLFEPFEQARAGQKMKQGTGLGLSISQRFVQLMGGEITASSQLGAGSQFSFQIPVTPLSGGIGVLPSTTPGYSQAKVIGLAPFQPDFKILIVDDLPDNLQLLSELLSSVGFLVQQAHNGEEAVAQWRSWQPQLIWMDLLMPKMDGYEAVRFIREGPEQLSQPVIIALTASVLREKREATLSAGFDGYLTKPFKVAEVWAILEQHLKVRYRYDAALPDGADGSDRSTTQRATDEMARAPHALAAALKAQPQDWQAAMHQAATQLKGKRVAELIEQLPSEEAAVATALQDFADNYQFDKILTLLQEPSSDFS
ncbi:MAG: ammonium transporter [Cyanobacteria bacterium J06634_5]